MKFLKKKQYLLPLLLSLLFHIIFLSEFPAKDLLSSDSAPLETDPQPLELEFENPPEPEPNQPETAEPEKNRPEKFYRIMENPNAGGKQPDQSDILSSASSVSASPVPSQNAQREIPGQPDQKQTQANEQPEQVQKPEVAKALENAVMAYREKSSFDRSALTGRDKTAIPKKRSPEDSSAGQQASGEEAPPLEGFRAEMVGDFALSTYEWEWAPYWLAFKRQLQRVWYAPPAYYNLGLIHGYTIVQFTIQRDGRMTGFQVLHHVGHHSLETSSINAVRSVFPFLPLPANFPEDTLQIKLKLFYPDLRSLSASP
ncbi:MAG: energy transducer TonB [Calditrichia bacterium]